MKKLMNLLVALTLSFATTTFVHASVYAYLPQQHLTKNGKVDKRYNENKHLKKDGSMDIRYKSSKKTNAKK
jgi:hypothetical protein